MQDKDVKRIYCPTCGKWLLCVSKKTEGVIYPFCKRCHKEIEIKVISIKTDKQIK